MTTATKDKLRDLLDGFEHAMLVTRATDGQLRSCPMVLADAEEDGTLWFMTQRQSGKVQEITRDDHVNVAMQSSTKFVSISGLAEMVEDRQKVDQLWNEAWKVWFPKGKGDPTLALLRVDGKSGEYWDQGGVNGIKYLIEAGKAYLHGTRPDLDDDPKVHGKVDL